MTASKKIPNNAPRSTKRPHRRVQTEIHGVSRTKQSFKDECDINNIVGQFIKTGQFTHINLREPKYGIVPSQDFRQAMDKITTAQNTFDQLPAEIRARFGNSPASFFDFALDDKNEDELRNLGLLPPLPVEKEAEPAAKQKVEPDAKPDPSEDT